MTGGKIVWCLIPLLCIVADAQRDSKWSWSSNNRNSVDRSVDHDRTVDRRKYENLEDFRDRYEVSEQTTRKPSIQSDDYYGNGGFGGNGPTVTGNGYNGNGFGQFVPQGLGGIGPNNYNNYPGYGNQFNGPYNPGFGYQPNYKPGYNNYYPNNINGGFGPNYGNGNGYYPGGYGPNRYPYNPLGNSAANGILTGPGGPTGLYGRPQNFGGPNQLPFGPNGPGGLYNGPYNNGIYNNGPYNPGFNNYGGYNPYNGGYPQNGIIPFNSKAGSGIQAEADEPKGSEQLDKKSNE